MRKSFWILVALAALLSRAADDDSAVRDRISQPWWKPIYEGQLDAIRKSGGKFDFVLIGDSITRNWSTEKGASYFGGERKLGKAVSDELFGNYRWLNAGIGGDGTAHVLWRCNHGILDGYETGLITLMVGTNDRTDSAEKVAEGIREIVAVIRRKQPKAKLLLIPILPRFVREDDPGDMNAKNEKTNEIIRRLCDGKRVVWFDWRAGLYIDGALDKSLWFDREHPGDGGYRVWAKALLPYIDEAKSSASQAFGEARWMWPVELGCVTNTVVEFRKTFRAAKPTALQMNIAADTVYAVELNGRFVHSGRFPDVPPQRYFDTRAIGEARTGENELLVRLYVQGAPSFQTIPGDPGVMFAVTGEGVRVNSGEGVAWRVSNKDRREGVPMVTGQLGFSFEYDAAVPDATWRRIGNDDARRGWQDFVLSPRPVPAVEILPPVDARLVAQGLLDGSLVPGEVAPGMDAAVMTPLAENRFFASDGKSVRPEAFTSGFYYLIDLGCEEAGFLVLDVEADAGTVIDIGHAEHSENGRITAFVGGRNFAGRYRCREGRQQYCRWARRMAGRYLQLHVRGAKTRFALHRATVCPAVYPVAERPAPSGLNDVQRKIWDVSVRTLRLCMHEHYEDCPWREQALYGNDARNQMLCGYQAFNADNRMPELALTVHSRGVNDDGWQTMCMPAQISLIIPSFTFCWVLAVDDNLRYRGDLAFVRTMMPSVHKILDTHVREVREGLLPCPAGRSYWQFYEWSTDMAGDLSGPDYVKLGERRYESPLNMFFVLALDAGARCAAATDDARTAARWREAAKVLRDEIGRRFWNAEGKFLDMRLGKSLRPSEFTQSLALLAGVVPPGERTGVVRKLMARSDWTEITLSQTLYKYEALLAAGGEAAAAVVPMMDAEWKKMLGAGATSFWEMREGWTAFGNAGSLCHGWSAIPVYIYGAYRP